MATLARDLQGEMSEADTLIHVVQATAVGPDTLTATADQHQHTYPRLNGDRMGNQRVLPARRHERCRQHRRGRN